MSNAACISLGSNVGDRPATLDEALAEIAATPGLTLRAASSYHATRPVGGPSGQGEFLNAAALLETTLKPTELLEALQRVEQSAGRVRTVRWGERTLDLDLLLFGDRILLQPGLEIPHPRMAVRRFVLAPLAEVAPLARDPVTGRTVAELLANLDRRPGVVALRFPEGWPDANRFVAELSARLGGAPIVATAGTTAEQARLSRGRHLLPAGDMRCPRWIIALHRCDGLDPMAQGKPESADRAELNIEGRAMPDQHLRPTFASWLEPGGSSNDARQWLTERPGAAEFTGQGVPILRLDASDPQVALVEIVAACSASRPEDLPTG